MIQVKAERLAGLPELLERGMFTNESLGPGLLATCPWYSGSPAHTRLVQQSRCAVHECVWIAPQEHLFGSQKKKNYA